MDSFANIFSGAGREFKSITQKEINQVMDKLNNCTGKCLGIKTPNQVFLGINPFVALAS
jgi:IS30 family transposase